MAVVMDEVETKYTVSNRTPLPPFETLAEVGYVAQEVHHLSATYFDTDDRSLLRSGVTLRWRTGGHDPGWHLKLPDATFRHEFHEPLSDAADMPPETFVSLTWGLHRGRPLSAVATIETDRTIVRLSDTEGGRLGDVCDDRVTAQSLGRAGHAQHWREWEIEVAEPDSSAPVAAARLMVRAGAVPATSPNKLAHVLHISRRRSPAAPKGSAAAVLGPLLGAQVAEFRRLDPLVRADMPDAVHRLRVVARRLRAELGVYGRLFDRSVTDPVRIDLAWAIAELGRPRDAEVVQEGLEALSTGGGLATQQLEEEHCRAHQRAMASLTTARYLHLLDTLDCIAAHPPWRRAAFRPAPRQLLRRVRTCVRHLDRAVAAVDPWPSSEGRDRRLHDVRKQARKLRYAIEAAPRTLGSEAGPYALLLADLQDVLGDHHDKVVARTRVDHVVSGLSPSTVASLRATLDEAIGLRETQYNKLLPRLLAYPWQTV